MEGKPWLSFQRVISDFSIWHSRRLVAVGVVMLYFALIIITCRIYVFKKYMWHCLQGWFEACAIFTHILKVGMRPNLGIPRMEDSWNKVCFGITSLELNTPIIQGRHGLGRWRRSSSLPKAATVSAWEAGRAGANWSLACSWTHLSSVASQQGTGRWKTPDR